MAALAAVSGIVSGMTSAAGSMMAAKGQANSLEAQANVKRSEQMMNLRRGVAEQGAATYEALDKYRERDKAVGDAQWKFAGSGGGVLGSARHRMGELHERGSYLGDTKVAEGAQRKQDRESQAAILHMEETALRSAASTTRRAGMFNAASGVLSGVSGIARAGGTFGPIGQRNEYYYG